MTEWNIIKSMAVGAMTLGIAFGASAWFRRKEMGREELPREEIPREETVHREMAWKRMDGSRSGLLVPWGWEAGGKRRLFRGLSQGVFLFLLVSLLGGLINLIFPAPPHPVEEFFRSSRSGPELPTLLLLLLAAGIFAPVAEECFFRGFFLPALARRWGWTRAIHGSAFVFAALHGDAYRFLPLYAAGCWLGRVVSRERTLLPAIVAHAVWNLIGLALLYLGMLYMGGIG